MKIKILTALLFIICKGILFGQQIYFQGFELGDNWDILSGSSKISNDDGASYFPANQTIRSGSNFWKVNNSTDTLILQSKSVIGQSNIKVIVRLASISVTSNNGAEPTDFVQVYAILDGVTPTQPDVTVTGSTSNNSRWGYNASLVGTTTAGNPATFASPQGGFSNNNYATIEIHIPNGTSTVGLMLIGKNNSTNEIWAIDDIELVACPSVSISGPQTGCIGDTLTFTSTHIGNWSLNNSSATAVSNPNNSNFFQIVIVNGTSVSVTQNVNGCDFTQNINIFTNPTPPFIGPTNPVCQGNSAVLTANSPNNSVLWFEEIGGNYIIIGTGNSFTTPPITQTGTVTFYAASQNANGCFSNKVPVQVTVNPSPTKFDISGAIVCGQNDAYISLDGSENGIEYELFVNGQATGQVLNGNGNPLHFVISNPIQGSTVAISAFEPNSGCTTFTDTITLNLVNLPNNFYAFNVDTLVICENEVGNFSLNGSQLGVQYFVTVNGNITNISQFGTGQTLNFSVPNLENGDIIQLFILDTLTGCYNDLLDYIVTIVKPKPEILIYENSGIFSSDSTTGTFVWYYNGNILTGQNQPTLDITQAGTSSGTYFLVYTNSFGCSDTSNTIQLIISDLEKDFKQLIQVYPNPFHHFISINAPFHVTMKIKNILGVSIHEQNLKEGKNLVLLEDLSSGVYILELYYQNQKWVTKLVKE